MSKPSPNRVERERDRTGERLLYVFRGRWRIERDIAGEAARFTGEALFEPSGGGLDYAESGILTLASGRSLQAHRSYRYVPVEEGMAVEFADGPGKGGLFVLLNFVECGPSMLEAREVHRCGKDVYSVTYRLLSNDSFETDIAVAGPRKAYRAVSLYTRLC